jgi:hypothetical protein
MRIFTCNHCKKEFSPKYRLSSNRALFFCSKSCKTLAQCGKYFNKTQFENAILKVIKRNNHYMTAQMLMKDMKISDKYFRKFNVSIIDVNKRAGHRQPRHVCEYFVGLSLDSLFGANNVVREKSFDTCLSPKGHNLRYDFFIKNRSLLIEVDGKQHMDKNNPWHSEYSVLCDNIKTNWAYNNDYSLVRIPWVRIVTEEYVRSCLKAAGATT